jgi:hypothetical protein
VEDHTKLPRQQPGVIVHLACLKVLQGSCGLVQCGFLEEFTRSYASVVNLVTQPHSALEADESNQGSAIMGSF